MKGYLYNILDECLEELYWSEEEINPELLKIEYYLYMKEDDDLEFEEWWNQDDNKKTKIHRVFIEEVYL